MRPLASLLACLLAATGVQADERRRIADERRALDARYAQDLRACHEQFVVTSCVDDARQRWRQALAPLREQEQGLDEAARQQRARERQAELVARQAKAAQRAASSTTQGTRLAKPPRAASSAAAGASDVPASSASKAGAKDFSADAQARERARTAQAVRTQSELDQQRIAQRERQSAAKGKRSDPLPVPPPSTRP
jgi:hypothetical protein